jgi:hypothetical protein
LETIGERHKKEYEKIIDLITTLREKKDATSEREMIGIITKFCEDNGYAAVSDDGDRIYDMGKTYFLEKIEERLVDNMVYKNIITDIRGELEKQSKEYLEQCKDFVCDIDDILAIKDNSSL